MVVIKCDQACRTFCLYFFMASVLIRTSCWMSSQTLNSAPSSSSVRANSCASKALLLSEMFFRFQCRSRNSRSLAFSPPTKLPSICFSLANGFIHFKTQISSARCRIAKAATFNIDECKQTSFEIPQLKYNNFTYLFKVSCASSSSWIFYITNENSQV